MKSLFIKCPKCDKEFNCISKYGDKNKFCSRSCANSRFWDNDKKARHSKIAKRHVNYKPPKMVKRTCPCGKEFITRPFKKKKYCCIICANNHKPKINCGGYREGSGRSKSGYYKGFYCGSTYELCWVIYNLDHSLYFKRFEGVLEKNGLKYVPDFLIGDKQIVEIKGYETELVNKKTSLAESFGYSVKVMYKEDLKEIFSYVESKYGTKNFYTLYDNYKPTFNGFCDYCKKEFFSERKKQKTINVFCSRICSGKFRKIKNTPCR